MRGHVRKRGGTWSIVYDERRDPATGERRQREVGGHRTRAEAETALAEAVAAVKLGGYVEPDQVTVAAFLADWVDVKEDDDLKPSTAAGYRSKIRAHLVPRLGGWRVQDLDVTTIERALRGVHRTGGRDGGPVALSTVRKCRQLLSAALDDAVRRGVLATNPARLARVPGKERPDYEPRNQPQQPWTAVELLDFLAKVAEERLAALWLVYSATGARRGELLALKWDDVDLDRGVVSIRRNRTPGNDGDGRRVVVDVSSPKSAASTRDVSIDAGTVEALREHRRRQLVEMMAARDVWIDEGRVFALEDGTGLDPDWVSQDFARLIAATGARYVRLHDLRHGHATLLLAQGVPIEVVSKRLGHSRISTTYDLYVHPDERAQRDAADVWGRMLSDGEAG